MTRARDDKGGDRGAPIEDPEAIREVLESLAETEAEFNIKVEGTATLPYAAWVQALHLDEGRVVLRLVRPLPHEMPTGALFRMTFSAGEQRFEGVLALACREAYLQYAFQCPARLFLADRRRHKRYPFRPRENVYAILQDAGIPGLGVAGPLVNISMGGMALRVDRVLHLDDGMRVPVSSALFERGKGFPRFRLQDLPRLPLLEGRAVCAHATEHGSELVLGVRFPDLDPALEAELAQSLALRERMGRGGTAPRSDGDPAAARTGRGPEPVEAAGQPDGEPAAAVAAGVPVLDRLRRRTARVVLVMAEGPLRSAVEALLRDQGYLRLEAVDGLDQLPALCDPAQRRALPALVLADLALERRGDAEPLAAARAIEGRLAALGDRPAAILCEEVDPTLLLAPETHARFLSYPDGDPERWVAALDGLIG
jgi:hypothetical protein